MRIPESSKVALALRGLNDSSVKANKISEQVASGKKINRPSDDPVASARIEGLKSDILKREHALKTLNLDRLWLDTVDSSTGRMVEILRYAKVKALEAANSFQSPESLAAISAEIQALQQELLDLGNTKVNDLYIYSGSKTFSPSLVEGWPYQLPGIAGLTNLTVTAKPIDEIFIRDLFIKEDEQPTKSLDLKFSTFWNANNTELQNEEKIIANPNPFGLSNPNTGPYQYTVPINANDSATDIVKKLNSALAGKYFNEVSDTLPSGFKQDAYFYLGSDDRIYMQSLPGVTSGFDKSFQEAMPFSTVSEVPADILPIGQKVEGIFGEYVEGFSDKDLLVRITKPGKIGDARYAVSDDGGNTWSQDRQLNWSNEIYNPEGSASMHVFINFIRPEIEKFLPENLEFSIAKNHSVIYQGNNQARVTPQENGYKTKINITGQQLFFGDGGADSAAVFDVLERLKNNVAKGYIDDISKQINELDTSVDQVLSLRAASGITTKKLENAQIRIEQKNLDSTRALSELEDADLAKLASELSLNAIQRQAIMETTARIIQPSLVQFLR